MSPFTFKEEDHSGLNTLHAIGKADRFNRWMYEEVKNWMKGSILEIGSGIGNISGYFIAEKRNITLSDIRSHYIEHLKKRFPSLPSEKFIEMDLVDPEFREKFKHLESSFDSAFALNVIEHIQDDSLALENIRFLLKPGSVFLMLVPAHKSLYNQLDRVLHHFRRYDEDSGRKLFQETGFTVEDSWFFNSAGIPAWWWGGMTSRSGEISSEQMSLYDKLVPVIRMLDKAAGRRIGLSIIVAGRKDGFAEYSR